MILSATPHAAGTRTPSSRAPRHRALRHGAGQVVLLLALLGAPFGAAGAQPSDGHKGLQVAGQWLTQDRTTVLDIEPCGARMCGRIVGMTKWPRTGVPTDLHDVPECGMTILHGTRRAEADLWAGDILDPDHGRDYTAEFWLGEEGGLHLHGYIGLPLFGLTEIWTRYPYAPPPDCHLYADTRR